MPRNRRLGADSEDRAAEFLQGLGYTIVTRNYHARVAEVDIIAMDGDTLVFVEVRERKIGSLISAEETVTPSKMRKMCSAAEKYLSEVADKEMPVRFDFIAIEGGELRHYVDAFRPA